jgi:hypothetical protein
VDPAHFITYGEDGEETLGPIVIWVGVYSGSTQPLPPPTLPTKYPRT